MKRNLSHMLMAITLTMAFTGCQSTPDMVTEVTKEETPQRITITLHLADIAESRATGNPSVVDAWGQQVDCRLSQLLFATFDDDGKLLSNHADTYEQDKVYRFTTYRSATKLVIFANVSATTLWDIANCSELSSTNFGGLSALLGMLNSCASNVAVVNIDAGFKAGCVAGLIARRSKPAE